MQDKNNILVIDSLAKHYSTRKSSDKTVKVFDDFNLTLKKNTFLSILGASGCGKTTLLKTIAGLIIPTAGTVSLNGRVINGPPTEAVLLFQEYNKSLLPWRNVLDNVRLGLEARRLERTQQYDKAKEYLQLVGLESVKNYYPWQLSGGMQQRVALARALACEPEILLADEPFGSLDALTRSRMEDELLTLWATLKFTVLFVTHDIDEAVYLSDRILLIGGQPALILKDLEVQLDRPRDQISTRSSRSFATLRAQLYEAMLNYNL